MIALLLMHIKNVVQRRLESARERAKKEPEAGEPIRDGYPTRVVPGFQAIVGILAGQGGRT
jgi:hypothetical protein